MRVLVTGGGGFLGAALVRALAARGDTAIAFDTRFMPGLLADADGNPNIVARNGDITDTANLRQVFETDAPGAVLHCAAIVGVTPSIASAANVFRVNVEGAINLFETMKLFAVRRVVHISSEEIYGDFNADVIDETHPKNPVFAYGITKAAVESLGRTYGLTDGLECINVRTSWVYGPDFPRMRVPRDMLEAAVEGRSLHLPCGGDSKIDHTYICDLVDGTIKALDHAGHKFDAYHIASGDCPTLFEMAEHVRELVPGADISIGPGAYRHAGDIEIPRKGALDGTRARQAFGYSPRFDLRAGLAANLADYRRRRRDGADSGSKTSTIAREGV